MNFHSWKTWVNLEFRIDLLGRNVTCLISFYRLENIGKFGVAHKSIRTKCYMLTCFPNEGTK